MGKIIKGPFDFKLGANTLTDIESVKFDYKVDSDDKKTVQGRTRRVYGTHMVNVTATFLFSDVASLAVVLPQYFVANGGTLSTGETVTDSNGAIDIVPGGCAAGLTKTNLIINSCGTDGEVLRVLDCITEIAGISLDEKNRTIDVEFTGQSDHATIQMFTKGAIAVVS